MSTFFHLGSLLKLTVAALKLNFLTEWSFTICKLRHCHFLLLNPNAAIDTVFPLLCFEPLLTLLIASPYSIEVQIKLLVHIAMDRNAKHLRL